MLLPEKEVIAMHKKLLSGMMWLHEKWK